MIENSGDLKRIEGFFDRFIFGLMKGDLKNALQAHTDHLAALGLAVCTEVLGGLLTGELREERKSKSNFKAFLKYMGNEYFKYADQLYNTVRCGLVHEYFLREEPPAKLLSKYWAVRGVFEEEGKLFLHLPTYFHDLFESAEKYYQELKSRNNDLISKFNKAAWADVEDI